MARTTDSNNNYAEFGTFKRTSTFRKSKPQGKVNVFSNLNKLREFYDVRGLEFDEDIFKNILRG